MKQQTITSKELDFATFCIGNLAERLKMSQTEVYDRLKRSGILMGYIIPGYEVLHTFSSQYITDDLVDYMHKKGALT